MRQDAEIASGLHRIAELAAATVKLWKEEDGDDDFKEFLFGYSDAIQGLRIDPPSDKFLQASYEKGYLDGKADREAILSDDERS